MAADIIPVDVLKTHIKSFEDPALSFEAEAAWKANAAFAKESRDYESLVNCFQGWILQRRRTTELVLAALPDPGSYFGNQYEVGPEDVTRLIDFGFSKMQWHRRRRELDIDSDVIDTYLDDCINKDLVPSMHGLLNYALGSGSGTHRDGMVRCDSCGGSGWISKVGGK